MLRKSTAPLAAALLLGAGAVRADTVEVSSVTFLNVADQTRGGLPGQAPEVVTVAPLFEILNVSAHSVTNPAVKDLQLVVSTWGSYELGDPRWDNGTGSDFTGDVVAAYAAGRLFGDVLTLRVGRAQVMTGVSRMIQLDGGEAIVTAPLGRVGLRVSGYAGVPVSQRFTSRSGLVSWNPAAGDLAYGGRVSLSYALPGKASGRGLDVGASINQVEDGGDPVREEAGVDFRFQPGRTFNVFGSGAYSLYDGEVSEAQLAISWAAARRWHVTADARYVVPDLLLSRSSILSVFSDGERSDYGGGVRYQLAKGLDVGADYHLAVEPDEGGGDYYGHDAAVLLDWRRGDTSAGAELVYLDALENGYTGARIFGRRDVGKVFVAADVITHFLREDVNGESVAVTGALTGGMKLPKGFSAVVSGRAGVTPFMEQTFELMAKLVYNQVYQAREVR
jgi:hypothetical protein